MPNAPTKPQQRKPSPALWWGIGFLICALVMLVWQFLAPDTLERAVGEAKVAVEQAIQEADPGWQGPVVRLGPEGDMAALDRCDGSFIEMTSYRMSDVPPVYAAHNNCGGDVILGLSLGDTVLIEGRDTLYTVVDERHTPKWSMATKLRGMSGEVVVQTCYYGQDKMRFLGLEPIAPSAPESAR